MSIILNLRENDLIVTYGPLRHMQISDIYIAFQQQMIILSSSVVDHPMQFPFVVSKIWGLLILFL